MGTEPHGRQRNPTRTLPCAYAGGCDAESRVRPLSWEEAPGRGRRGWLVPVVVGVVLLATAGAVLAARSRDDGLMVVGPTPAAGRDDATEPAAFPVQRLEPLSVRSETAGTGPLVDGAPDLTVVVGGRQHLFLIDTATGDVRQLRLAVTTRPPPPGLPTMFRAGEDLIINHHGTVVRIPRGSRRPVLMAEDRRAIVTFDDTSVWMSDALTSATPATAARVAHDGTVIERVRLPAVSRAVAGTAEGLVITAPGAISLVNGDGDEEISSSGDLLATDGERLARADCESALRCLVVLGTLDAPDQVRVPLDPADVPAGYFGLPTGTYSPDGRWLAFPLYRVDETGALQRPWITVVDTATGAEAFRVQGPFTQAFTALPVAWSPDSEWLFAASEDGITSWNATTGVSAALDLDMDPPVALAVLPANPPPP